jgi:hypothetical protein
MSLGDILRNNHKIAILGAGGKRFGSMAFGRGEPVWGRVGTSYPASWCG